MSLPTYPMDLYGYVPYAASADTTELQLQDRPSAPCYLGKKSAAQRDNWLNVCTAIALGGLSVFMLTGAIVQFTLHQAHTPQSPWEMPSDLKARALSHLP
jgi:hypothetical protein